MKLPQKYLWFLALIIGVIILLTVSLAPQNSKISNGSSYNRAPNGYGAWYALMEKQGIPIQRWQKPIEKLPKNRNAITLLRVSGELVEDGVYANDVRQWVEKGNTLVILGVRSSATNANFSTMQPSQEGKVKIDTSRRRKELEKTEQEQLGDRFGTIVWSENFGKGRIIYATTPYLAANAYQDEPGNYKFLAKLVTENSKSVLVDEYIHGYKDKETIEQEQKGKDNWIAYLAKTPLVVIFLQVGIISIVLIIANNRRLGQPVTLTSPVVDNSEAYIQALAAILRKANSSAFVVEVVGKEEQMQLQKALGLDTTPVDKQTLIDAWVRQTDRPASELQEVLQLQSKKRQLTEKNLLTWLQKWHNIRTLSNR